MLVLWKYMIKICLFFNNFGCLSVHFAGRLGPGVPGALSSQFKTEWWPTVIYWMVSAPKWCTADLMKDYWCWFLSLLLSVPCRLRQEGSSLSKKNPILSRSGVSITFPCQRINLICSKTNLQTKNSSCKYRTWPLVIEVPMIMSLGEQCSLVG